VEESVSSFSRSSGKILTVGFTCTTVDSPVVVAMVEDVAFAVEKKTVFAPFVGQGPIYTEKELVAVLGVWMGFHPNWRAVLG